MWKPIEIGASCEKVLQFLKEKRQVSGEEIASICSCSRTAVWKCMKKLKKFGYQILSSPRAGYRLLSVPDIPYPWELRGNFKLFKEFIFFREIDSTNTYLFAKAKEGIPEGTVVIAERQLQGKGRHGRKWISPPGNIYLSVLLRPKCEVQDGLYITLLSGVAVSDALKKYGVNVLIKWPNDIVLREKKLCGILCETELEDGKIDFIVVGIGLNLVLPEIRGEELKNAISLSECGINLGRVELIRDILKEFEVLYEIFLKNEKEIIRRKYLQMTFPRGKMISVKTERGIIKGRFWGIDKDGSLIVWGKNGRKKKIYSAEVM